MNNNLLQELKDLQESLAMIDLLNRPSKRGSLEILVKKLQDVRIKMSPDPNHQRPHFHIDYNKKFHAASIAVDDCTILAGEIPKSHLNTVLQWTQDNRGKLLTLWETLKEGKDAKPFILELSKD